ncbi:hypothetical protein [Sphingobacterium mizutaii]|uniref:hypothetical protein n=1 Tax=Sphingobacterium mizutaii TaxID=1010 RepID=UPI0016232245|nr:hypothetical protein [Sphingobacterium mizutaii]
MNKTIKVSVHVKGDEYKDVWLFIDQICCVENFPNSPFSKSIIITTKGEFLVKEGFKDIEALLTDFISTIKFINSLTFNRAIGVLVNPNQILYLESNKQGQTEINFCTLHKDYSILLFNSVDEVNELIKLK